MIRRGRTSSGSDSISLKTWRSRWHGWQGSSRRGHLASELRLTGNPASPNSRNRIDGPDRRLERKGPCSCGSRNKFEKGRESGARSYGETSPVPGVCGPAGGVRIEFATLKTLVSAPIPIASVRVAQSTSPESRPRLRVHFRNCRSPARSPAKVDESALRICAKQGYLDAVADVQPVLAPHEAAFHGRIERPHENAFGRDAGHDR